MPTSYGLSYSTYSLPRSACTIGAFGRRIVAGILDADLLAHVVLHLGDALGQMTHRLVGGRQWQQVIELPFLPAA